MEINYVLSLSLRLIVGFIIFRFRRDLQRAMKEEIHTNTNKNSRCGHKVSPTCWAEIPTRACEHGKLHSYEFTTLRPTLLYYCYYRPSNIVLL